MAAIPIALYRQPEVQSDLADIIRVVFAMIMLSFYLGLIGPRAIGQGGQKRPSGRGLMYLLFIRGGTGRNDFDAGPPLPMARVMDARIKITKSRHQIKKQVHR